MPHFTPFLSCLAISQHYWIPPFVRIYWRELSHQIQINPDQIISAHHFFQHNKAGANEVIEIGRLVIVVFFGVSTIHSYLTPTAGHNQASGGTIIDLVVCTSLLHIQLQNKACPCQRDQDEVLSCSIFTKNTLWRKENISILSIQIKLHSSTAIPRKINETPGNIKSNDNSTNPLFTITILRWAQITCSRAHTSKTRIQLASRWHCYSYRPLPLIFTGLFILSIRRCYVSSRRRAHLVDHHQNARVAHIAAMRDTLKDRLMDIEKALITKVCRWFNNFVSLSNCTIHISTLHVCSKNASKCKYSHSMSRDNLLDGITMHTSITAYVKITISKWRWRFTNW